jgi:hypothetical protein
MGHSVDIPRGTPGVEKSLSHEALLDISPAPRFLGTWLRDFGCDVLLKLLV